MSLPWLQDDFKESSKSRSRSPLQKDVDKPAEPLPLKSRSRSLSPRKSRDKTSRHSRDSSRTRKKIERRTRHLRGKKHGSSSSSRSSSSRSSSSYSSSSNRSGSVPTRIIASMKSKYRKARLYITNIVSKEITRAELIKHFKKYGEILDVLIHVNNYAFIQYGTEGEARAAVDGERGQIFKHWEIGVKLAHEPRSRPKGERAGVSQFGERRRGRGRAGRKVRMRMQEKMAKKSADEPSERFGGGRNPERESAPYLPSRHDDPHAPPRGGPYPPPRAGPYPPPQHGEPFPPPHHRGPFPPHPMEPGPDSYHGRRPGPMYGPDRRAVDPYFEDRYRRGPPESWGVDGPYRPGEFEGPYREGFRPQHLPAECEIFVMNPGLLPYGEYVEERVKNFSIVTAVSVKPPHVSPIQLLEDLRAQKSLFAIFINDQNEEHKSLTLNVLHNHPQEHRNMPVDDAIPYIMDSFHGYVKGLKEKAKGGALKPPGKSSGSFLQASPDVAYLLHLLADNRSLTYEELDAIIQYLTKRRDTLVNPLKTRSLLDEDISRSDRRSADDYLKPSEDRRRSPESQHRSLDSRHRSPDGPRRSPEDRHRSPEDHNRSAEDRRRSPEDHRRSPEDRHRSPEDRRRSPEEGYRKPQQNHRRSSDNLSPPIHPDDMFKSPKEENAKTAKASSSLLAQDLKSKILNILNSVRSGQGVQAAVEAQQPFPTGVSAPTPPIQAPPPLPPMPSLPPLPIKDFDNFQNSSAQDSMDSMFPNNSSGLRSMNTNMFQGNSGLSSMNTSMFQSNSGLSSTNTNMFQSNSGLSSMNTNMFQSNSGLSSMNSGFQDNLKGSNSMPATSQNMAASDFPSSYEAVGGGYDQGSYGQDTAQNWRMAPQGDDNDYVGGLRPRIEQEARRPPGMPYREDYNYPGMPDRMGLMGNNYRPPRY